VVLLEIDAGGVAVVEFECDAPRAVHVDRIADGRETPQRMKIKSRKVHFIRRRTGVKPVEPKQNPAVKTFVDFSGPASGPEIRKRFAPETENHSLT
jgi:hypothetical protein